MATLEIGPFKWDLVMDFQEISNTMTQKVDGILDEDVLREFDSVAIDFKHRWVFMLRKDQGPAADAGVPFN